MTIALEPSIQQIESLIPQHPNVSSNKPAFWVENISYSLQSDHHQSQREIQYLLIDHQFNLDSRETYIRVVRKVLTGGVEKASTFNIDFDPSYESIILHQLVIYRGDEVINPLLPGNSRILQRELSLERHILDGFLSLILIFSNVKTGDILDISYTRLGRNPVYAGHFNALEIFSFSGKIEKFAFRCIREKNRDLHFKVYNSSSTLVEEILDSSQVKTSYVVAPCRIIENFNTPSWYLSHELLQISDFQSWQEVSEWGKNLFQLDNRFEIDEVKKLVCKWKNEGKDTKTALVSAALNFVQNEIRYLGMEEGIYSHKPHPPQVTLANGYGDCKDKTALLKVFMDEIQIVSSPALVNTFYTCQLKDFLPSASIFNHVILYAIIDDEEYWLDATQKYEGGSLKDQSKLFYGSYLLLNGEDKCWINNPTALNRFEIDVDSHYIFNAENIELKLKTTFLHAKADLYRAAIAHEGKDGLAKQYLDFFSNRYGAIQVKEPMTLEDDIQLNRITILENYTIEKANIENGKFDISVYSMPEYFPSKVSLSRREPLHLGFPIKISESFRISSNDKQQQPSDFVNLKHPSFIFDYQTFQEGDDIIGKYLYETSSDHILPEDFNSLRGILSKMNENLHLTYSFKINGNMNENSDNFCSFASIYRKGHEKIKKTLFKIGENKVKSSIKLGWFMFLLYFYYKLFSNF